MDEPRFCTKCGHEISVGSEFCAYCGTRVTSVSDPVASGAKYERYDDGDSGVEGKAKWEGNEPASAVPLKSFVSGIVHAQTICFKCGNTIPNDSEFCPICQTKLFQDCPKCGHRFSAQFPNCNKCGTNRAEYLKYEEDEKQRRKEMRPKFLSSQFSFTDSYEPKFAVTFLGTLKNAVSISVHGHNEKETIWVTKLIDGTIDNDSYVIEVPGDKFQCLVAPFRLHQIVLLDLIAVGANGDETRIRYKVKVWHSIVGMSYFIEDVSVV